MLPYETEIRDRLISRAMRDRDFRELLLASAVDACREELGLIPPGCDVRVVADRRDVIHIVLPAQPDRDPR
ncbi:hypothetical protein BJF79_07075 [Actinomadura sp. CNU-125]|uniref:hypothetical protein n=1 Tax=Actinomadura sp. CNU-125 TaxID=1904961 RepID=UPI00095BB90C|nr:hypothetical protein [Actinomadura sp. CNU-125]OLT35196.1 hypothetical protein BJF79_07075 [Actinomadura sp. CNU-125]